MKRTISTILLSTLAAFAINVGEVPVEVSIANEDGGFLDGTTWNSLMLKDKVYVMFYVDPDEKDTNNELSKALKAKKYNLEKYSSIAVINLAATWLPNFAIESSLEEKQKLHPNTTYVKDKKSVLVKQWGLVDDSSDILLFDKDGKLLYSFAGKLDDTEIKKVLDLIDSHI